MNSLVLTNLIIGLVVLGTAHSGGFLLAQEVPALLQCVTSCLSDVTNLSPFSYRTEGELDEVCNIVHNATDCLKSMNCSLNGADIMPSVPSLPSVPLGLTKALEYLCSSSGRNAYQEMRECLNSTDLIELLFNCSVTSSRQSFHLTRWIDCKTVNIQMNCVESLVVPQCNKTSSSLTKVLLLHTYKPTATLYHCKLDGDDYDWDDDGIPDNEGFPFFSSNSADILPHTLLIMASIGYVFYAVLSWALWATLLPTTIPVQMNS